MTTIKNNNVRNCGATMVEFAIGIPIFLILILGIIDFSFALYAKTTIQNAAEQAAQLAAVVPDLEDVVKDLCVVNMNTGQEECSEVGIQENAPAMISIRDRAYKYMEGFLIGTLNDKEIEERKVNDKGVVQLLAVRDDEQGKATDKGIIEIKLPVQGAKYALEGEATEESKSLRDGLTRIPIEVTVHTKYKTLSPWIPDFVFTAKASAYRELSTKSNMPPLLECEKDEDGKCLCKPELINCNTAYQVAIRDERGVCACVNNTTNCGPNEVLYTDEEGSGCRCLYDIEGSGFVCAGVVGTYETGGGCYCNNCAENQEYSAEDNSCVCDYSKLVWKEVGDSICCDNSANPTPTDLKPTDEATFEGCKTVVNSACQCVQCGSNAHASEDGLECVCNDNYVKNASGNCQICNRGSVKKSDGAGNEWCECEKGLCKSLTPSSQIPTCDCDCEDNQTVQVIDGHWTCVDCPEGTERSANSSSLYCACSDPAKKGRTARDSCDCYKIYTLKEYFKENSNCYDPDHQKVNQDNCMCECDVSKLGGLDGDKMLQAHLIKNNDKYTCELSCDPNGCKGNKVPSKKSKTITINEKKETKYYCECQCPKYRDSQDDCTRQGASIFNAETCSCDSCGSGAWTVKETKKGYYECVCPENFVVTEEEGSMVCECPLTPEDCITKNGLGKLNTDTCACECDDEEANTPNSKQYCYDKKVAYYTEICSCDISDGITGGGVAAGDLAGGGGGGSCNETAVQKWCSDRGLKFNKATCDCECRDRNKTYNSATERCECNYTEAQKREISAWCKDHGYNPFSEDTCDCGGIGSCSNNEVLSYKTETIEGVSVKLPNCVCRNNYIRKDGICVCDENKYFKAYGGNCVCENNRSLINGSCTCVSNEFEAGTDNCVCRNQDFREATEAGCICIANTFQDANGNCVCDSKKGYAAGTDAQGNHTCVCDNSQGYYSEKGSCSCKEEKCCTATGATFNGTTCVCDTTNGYKGDGLSCTCTDSAKCGKGGSGGGDGKGNSSGAGPNNVDIATLEELCEKTGGTFIREGNAAYCKCEDSVAVKGSTCSCNITEGETKTKYEACIKDSRNFSITQCSCCTPYQTISTEGEEIGDCVCKYASDVDGAAFGSDGTKCPEGTYFDYEKCDCLSCGENTTSTGGVGVEACACDSYHKLGESSDITKLNCEECKYSEEGGKHFEEECDNDDEYFDYAECACVTCTTNPNQRLSEDGSGCICDGNYRAGTPNTLEDSQTPTDSKSLNCECSEEVQALVKEKCAHEGKQFKEASCECVDCAEDGTVFVGNEDGTGCDCTTGIDGDDDITTSEEKCHEQGQYLIDTTNCSCDFCPDGTELVPHSGSSSASIYTQCACIYDRDSLTGRAKKKDGAGAANLGDFCQGENQHLVMNGSYCECQTCTENSVWDEEVGDCICNSGFVMQNEECVSCGENEIVEDNTCVCKYDDNGNLKGNSKINIGCGEDERYYADECACGCDETKIQCGHQSLVASRNSKGECVCVCESGKKEVTIGEKKVCMTESEIENCGDITKIAGCDYMETTSEWVVRSKQG
ncbi:MAG: TadE/TadG family type IV pilus assembly protein [Bdellovibrionota bacterium]|jgi:hypothetical protein